jgi:hypothetical protein
LVSTTRPGAISLISNHFKLRVINKGTITMYSVDFGAKIGPDEKFRRYEAVRNCTTKLNDIVGKFIYNSGLIFSMIDAG